MFTLNKILIPMSIIIFTDLNFNIKEKDILN